MKKSIVILMILVTMFSCKKAPDPTIVNVVIKENPVGGNRQRSVALSYDVTLIGEEKPVELTIEWWWENGFHTNEKIVSTDVFTITSGSTVSKSTVYSVGAGYYLLNYYWVKIKWTDDAGQHEIESSKAYCSTK